VALRQVIAIAHIGTYMPPEERKSRFHMWLDLLFERAVRDHREKRVLTEPPVSGDDRHQKGKES
jgi:hypothetical protein